MKLVVFGATGGTGTRLLEKGLAAGHEMIAAARRPEAVSTKHERLRVVRCDALVPDDVATAVAGADVALSAIGPANEKQPGTLISRSVANILAAGAHAGLRRFVFESGLMVGDGTGLGPLSRLGIAVFRRLYAPLCADKRAAEAHIIESGMDYVIVRPPTLDDREYGAIRSGVDIAINAAKKIGHADVARFMIEAATDPSLSRTIQTIGR